MINVVAIQGRLGRDAELRYSKSGTPIVTLSMCVNERVKQSDGTWGDRPSWVSVTSFGKYSETILPSLVKGAKVTVAGYLRESRWEKDGQKRSKLEVVANSISVDSQKTSADEAAAATQPETYAADEDIPF